MRGDGRAFAGFALVLLAGTLLGSAVAVSRFAYDGGASGIVVALVRSIIMCLAIATGMKVSGRTVALPPALVPYAVVNGVLMAAMTYGNIGAVEFIPIGLASLLFFTFPVMIAVLVVALGLEPVKLLKLAAIVLAFAGLAVMLGASFGRVDWRGPAFSLVAAVATAVNAILVARHFRHVNAFAATLWFSTVGLAVLAVIALGFAAVRLPHTAAGWGGVVGVGTLQTLGTPLYLYGISRIGALRGGMAINIQPVVAIAEAWLLFGEVPTALQGLGGMTVLLAIGLMQWSDLRDQRREAASLVARRARDAVPGGTFD